MSGETAMDHVGTTPFGARPITAGELARFRALDRAAERREAAEGPCPDKWALLRALAEARAAFGVSDRDLAVLAALLGFHPARALDLDSPEGLVVFPSNAALGARAHGMAESTLRRHLAALTAAGLIRRRDSPNGKRYAARDAGGGVVRAFGLDLAPLALRAPEIEAAAAVAREAALRLKRLRETATLQLRDAEKLAAFGAAAAPGAAPWEAFALRAAEQRRALRRRLDAPALASASADLAALRAEIDVALQFESEKSNGNDVDFERLHLNSKPDSHDSENRNESAVKAEPGRPDAERGAEARDVDDTRPIAFDRGSGEAERHQAAGDGGAPPPLDVLRRACPEIGLYARNGIGSWRDMVAAAEFVRPMLGISRDAWDAAQTAMGTETAAATIACLLERSDRIRSPGGYLRALTGKARGAGFSALPMVLALLGEGRRGS